MRPSPSLTRPSAELRPGWAETTAQLQAFIARRVDDPHTAADITQDVLARSLAAGALDEIENPVGWLYRAARNAVIDHYRQRRGPQPLDDADELPAHPDTGDDGPNDATRELARCLQPLVDELAPIYRDAVTRVDLRGETHQRAAAAAGISTSGMKSRVQRGRQQLRTHLTACCNVHTDNTGAIHSYQPGNRRCAANCG